ncbi:hypothetical protein [Bradyrhizobium sp. USDA 3256]
MKTLLVSLFLSLTITGAGAAESGNVRSGPVATMLQTSTAAACNRISGLCGRASDTKSSSIKQRIADDRIQGGTCDGKKKGDCCLNDSNGQCVARCASDGGDCNPTQ